MLNRQTGLTAHKIVSEYRNKFRALIYNTAASFYSILFIFKKKKHEIYWIFIPISYSFIMTILFYILPIDNFVKYGTIIFILVIAVIGYRVVFLKMIDEI